MLYICKVNEETMIEYLRGKLAGLEPTLAIVDCMGVGYGVNISLNTYSAIQGKDDVKLWITESIREDAYQLWGFSTRLERELFLQLITVSGIGAGIARMVLSAMTPAELCDVITSGNDKMLKQVKGIGPKAAQRIIVDLRDKLATLAADATYGSSSNGSNGSSGINTEVRNEAISALTMLGFSPAPTSKVVQEIMTKDPSLPVETVIKLALKML